MLGLSESVVSTHENLYYNLQGFQGSRKASATPRPYRHIMPQVGIYTFCRKGIAFIVRISDILSWINHNDVAEPAIGIISGTGSPRSTIDSTHPRHDMHILPRFCARFPIHKPAQLVKFQTIGLLCRKHFQLRFPLLQSGSSYFENLRHLPFAMVFFPKL